MITKGNCSIKPERNRGLTVLEVIVAVTIIAVLAFFAIPAFLAVEDKGKIAKTNEMIGMIGALIVEEYYAVDDQGFGSSAAPSLASTKGQWITLEEHIILLHFGKENSITVQMLFKNKIPKAPFKEGFEINIHEVDTGFAEWRGFPPEYKVLHAPKFSIRDKSHPNLVKTFSI